MVSHGILWVSLFLSAAMAVGGTIENNNATFPYRPFRPWPDMAQESKILVADPIINMQYHMGPVLTSAIHVYIIWYGTWAASQKSIIRDFLSSISAPSPVYGPSVQQWWSTVQTYTDQTGANISASIMIAGMVAIFLEIWPLIVKRIFH